MKSLWIPLTYKDRLRPILTQLGNFIFRVFEYFGSVTTLLVESTRQLTTKPRYPWLTIEQMYTLGVNSFGLVAVTIFSIGLVMALQFGFGLERFGGKFYVPKVLALSMVRELGPVFTCLMLAGRVGSGIASELGSMKVTQQIDAIRALGTSPIKRLVIPRVIALMVVAPLLTVFADLIGMFGGMLISHFELKIGAVFYWQQSREIIDLYDIFMGTGKTVIFALCIALTGCHYGLTARGGTQGVGEATTKAVVTSSILVLVSDFVLTKIFWIFR